MWEPQSLYFVKITSGSVTSFSNCIVYSMTHSILIIFLSSFKKRTFLAVINCFNYINFQFQTFWGYCHPTIYYFMSAELWFPDWLFPIFGGINALFKFPFCSLIPELCHKNYHVITGLNSSLNHWSIMIVGLTKPISGWLLSVCLCEAQVP